MFTAALRRRDRPCFPAGSPPDTLTLGNVFPGVRPIRQLAVPRRTRPAQVFNTRFWSENGGTQSPSATSWCGRAPGRPHGELGHDDARRAVPAPGGTFSVTDRVVSNGSKSSGRVHHALPVAFDGAKNAGDTLLAATRAVPALRRGRQHGDRGPDRPAEHGAQHLLPARVRGRPQHQRRGELRPTALRRRHHGGDHGDAPQPRRGLRGHDADLAHPRGRGAFSVTDTVASTWARSRRGRPPRGTYLSIDGAKRG